MKILGNIIWLLFGGIFVAVEYFIASIGLFITIIGIPFGQGGIASLAAFIALSVEGNSSAPTQDQQSGSGQ